MLSFLPTKTCFHRLHRGTLGCVGCRAMITVVLGEFLCGHKMSALEIHGSESLGRRQVPSFSHLAQQKKVRPPRHYTHGEGPLCGSRLLAEFAKVSRIHTIRVGLSSRLGRFLK